MVALTASAELQVSVVFELQLMVALMASAELQRAMASAEL